MKKIKILLLIILTFSFFNITGCKKDSDSNNLKVKENLSKSQLYEYFKKAYTNRKLYSEDFTQINTAYYEMSDSSSSIEGEYTNKVSYNSQTKEGYILTEEYLFGDDEESGQYSELLNMYIVKEDDNYLNYYTKKTSEEDVYDLFYIEENNLINQIKEENNITEEYVTMKNPNQYSTIDKYSEALKDALEKNYDEEQMIALTLDSFYMQEIDYNNYLYKAKFKYDDILAIEINISYTKSTITKYSYKLEGNNTMDSLGFTFTMIEKETIEYEKEFDSEGMNFDKSNFNDKIPGIQLNAEISLSLVAGFVTTELDFDRLVKKGENIIDSLSTIVSKYVGIEDQFEGWYYDNNFTNKVGINDVFVNDSIKIYGKIKRVSYEINKVEATNGYFSVISEAGKGDTVYVYAYPNTGYVITEMYYIESGSQQKNYFLEEFTMPNNEITVYVIFGDEVNIHSKEELIYYLQDNIYAADIYNLCADIDMNNIEWEPIELISKTINGNGHKIYNLTITGEYTEAGLFSIVEDSFIKNLGLVNVDIDISSNQSVEAGAIAGRIDESIIENCFASGTIRVYSQNYVAYAGGLIGSINHYENSYNLSILNNNYSNVDVFAISNTNIESLVVAGGICAVASKNVVIQNNYSTGNVFAQNNHVVYAGGLIGVFFETNRSSISNSYATGNVTSLSLNSYAYGGGLVGEEVAITYICYRYSNQTIQVTGKTGNGKINQIGINGTLNDIFFYTYNNWNSDYWNLSLDNHPILK